MKLHEIMFPELAGKWDELNLDALARKHFPEYAHGDNPLLDAKAQTEFVADMHGRYGVDYSHGGYLEDRSYLWRGHYHDPSKMTHLGIDFNVPAGTLVRMPFGGDVVSVTDDGDLAGGWGGRIVFKCRTHPFYFIIGHLDPDSLLVFHPSKKPRSWLGWYPPSHSIGLVGESHKNGGWFPHVHLQCVSYAEYETYDDPNDIDGYGGEPEPCSRRFPDPQRISDEYERGFK